MSDFIGLSHSFEVFEAFFNEHSNLDSRFFSVCFLCAIYWSCKCCEGKRREEKEGNGSESNYGQKKEKRVQRRKLDVDDVHHKSKRPHGPSKWKILLKISR